MTRDIEFLYDREAARHLPYARILPLRIRMTASPDVNPWFLAAILRLHRAATVQTVRPLYDDEGGLGEYMVFSVDNDDDALPQDFPSIELLFEGLEVHIKEALHELLILMLRREVRVRSILLNPCSVELFFTREDPHGVHPLAC